MSRYGDPFPSSSTATTGSSGYGGAAGVGDRWDTQRFFKERDERHEPALRRERRAAPPVDVLERPDRRASVSVEDYLRPPQQRYGAPARRPDRDYEDDHLVSSSDAIIPYKERRDISPHPEPRSRSRQPSVSAAAAPPPPPRPRFLRRQSSLDTFDRAATRRAHDYRHYDRDEYGPPVTPASVPQQRNPASFSEPDLDDVRIAEPDFYGDEEFRNMRQRERSETPRGRRYHSLREEVVREKVERPVPRRGKTRIPKRLVHIRAVIQLNYPFEDEGDSILIMKALAQENVDELIALTKEINRQADRPVPREKVVIGTKGDNVTLERNRSQSRRRPSTVRRDMSQARPQRRVSPPSPQPRTRQRRRSSPIRPMLRDTWYEDVIQPRMDKALVVPERPRRTDREIRAEIKALEEERRMLKTERSPARLPAPPTPDEIVVKRDYKGPSPRLLRAMMASLT